MKKYYSGSINVSFECVIVFIEGEQHNVDAKKIQGVS